MSLLARDIGCMEFAVFDARSPKWRIEAVRAGCDMPDEADFMIYMPDGFWSWLAEDQLDYVRDEIAREVRLQDHMVSSLLVVGLLVSGAVVFRWNPELVQALLATGLAIVIAWVAVMLVQIIRRSLQPHLPFED